MSKIILILWSILFNISHSKPGKSIPNIISEKQQAAKNICVFFSQHLIASEENKARTQIQLSQDDEVKQLLGTLKEMLFTKLQNIYTPIKNQLDTANNIVKLLNELITNPKITINDIGLFIKQIKNAQLDPEHKVLLLNILVIKVNHLCNTSSKLIAQIRAMLNVFSDKLSTLMNDYENTHNIKVQLSNITTFEEKLKIISINTNLNMDKLLEEWLRKRISKEGVIIKKFTAHEQMITEVFPLFILHSINIQAHEILLQIHHHSTIKQTKPHYTIVLPTELSILVNTYAGLEYEYIRLLALQNKLNQLD